MRYYDRGAVYFDDCEIMATTDQAKLVHIPDIDTEPVWVPRSQCHRDGEIHLTGETGLFAVSKWWAEKQEWV